jgi:hypothetical protein
VRAAAYRRCFFSALLAQEELEGGFRNRNLNLGGLTAPVGQQSWVLSQALLVVIMKQATRLLPLLATNSMLNAVLLPVSPVS